MRYQCPKCQNWVKDKSFFGMIHLCLTDEEFEYYKKQDWYVKQYNEIVKKLPEWLKSLIKEVYD